MFTLTLDFQLYKNIHHNSDAFCVLVDVDSEMLLHLQFKGITNRPKYKQLDLLVSSHPTNFGKVEELEDITAIRTILMSTSVNVDYKSHSLIGLILGYDLVVITDLEEILYD